VQVADMLAEPGDLNDHILQQLVEQGSGDPPPRTTAAQSRRR